MNSTICEAIKERLIIQFMYDEGYRLVEPYCYGISTAGREVLRGYQIGGFSRSHLPVEWKLFDLSKAGDIRPTKVKFNEIRPNYNPKDKAMVSIICFL